MAAARAANPAREKPQDLADKEIRPVVAEAFPLEKGADAHRYLQERKNVGQEVLTL